MSDIKKYYYLKLKDNFFDSQEVKILESMPNGIYYSNMLVKLYLKALKHDGALKLNEHISYNENMISVITNLDIEMVRKGLEVLASLNLIDRLDDGTIYMSNIQSFIGKSSSEADRKKLYREKIEEQKVSLEKEEEITSHKNAAEFPEINGTSADKYPPETRDIEIKDIDTRDTEYRVTDNRNIEPGDRQYKTADSKVLELKAIKNTYKGHKSMEKESVDSLSVSLLRYFENRTGSVGGLNLGALKEAVQIHGADNVQKAMDRALEKNKHTMVYINGILKNWAKEGYPREGEYNGNGGTGKNYAAGANEFSGFKPKKPKSISEEERRLVEQELM